MIEVHSAPQVDFDHLDGSAASTFNNNTSTITATRSTTVIVEGKSTITKQTPPAVSIKPVKKYQREDKGMFDCTINPSITWEPAYQVFYRINDNLRAFMTIFRSYIPDIRNQRKLLLTNRLVRRSIGKYLKVQISSLKLSNFLFQLII